MKVMNAGSIDIKKNSLNTFRLISALVVILDHLHSHIALPNQILGYDTGYVVSEIVTFINAVPLFFFISGYLIWGSVQNTKNMNTFYKKRFWRIYPELWCGVILEIITILLLYKHEMQWKSFVAFIFGQATIFQFWTPDFLKEYGVGTPNGSLWTIGIIVQFYIVVWLFRKLLKDRSKLFWLSMLLVSTLVGAGTFLLESMLPSIIYKLYCQIIVQYLWIFLLGIFVAENKETILNYLIRYWWVLLGVQIIWAFINFDIYSRSYPIVGTYLSCLSCLGIAYAFPKINIKIDISYSLFIYHMIVMNVFIELGYSKGWFVALTIVLVSVGISLISTLVIQQWLKKIKAEKVKNL